MEQAQQILVEVAGRGNVATIRTNITSEQEVDAILGATALRFWRRRLLISNAGMPLQRH